jgi:hypothetical protein
VIQDVAGNFLVFDAQASKESITIRTAFRNNFWMIGDCDATD